MVTPVIVANGVGRWVSACAALGLSTLVLAPLSSTRAQQADGDGAAQTAPAEGTQPGAETTKPKRKPALAKKAEKADRTKAAQTPADTGANPPGGKPAAPATLADTAAAGAPAPTDVAAALKGAGAGRCADAIDAAAAPSMVGITQSNTVSTWSSQKPVDKHAASVVIGQRYGNNTAVPFGATTIVASPSGPCDMTVLQVVSSPLPCANVRGTLGKGKRVTDIAGLQLIQGDTNNTVLMPTGTNTCVLIDYKATFAP